MATLRRAGTLLILVAIAVLGIIVARQRLEWWNAAEGWQQDYFWQRCGFAVATTVDMPVVQLLIAGVYLLIASPRALQSRMTSRGIGHSPSNTETTEGIHESTSEMPPA